ncbi:hypothetical protein MMC09_004109 [Bachmanniomyces sp. S44760]|nr:hypothetical protein [Bachmanniomyces sp. S44760]
MTPSRSPPPSANSLDQRFTDLLLRPQHSPLSPGVDSICSQSQYSDGPESTTASSLDELDAHRTLRAGVYVPTVTFFDEQTEDLDIDAIASHAVRLARAGVAGLATQGSNGEAVHLTHKERKTVTSVTRRALNEAGFHSMPIIVGCGTQSTRETIELCQDAALSGGDYALVLPPSYYKAMFNSDSIFEYFQQVATASPLPILIYNYPAAVAGIDLDSDVIIKLASHPNIVGCKLTCGNTGKLNRIAAATHAVTPSSQGSGFMCMGGSADFTLQTLVGGGSGIIAGVANMVPKACARIIELYAAGEMAKASELQAVVARGDWAAITGGIVGTKSALHSYFGYGGYARKPLPRPTASEAKKFAAAFDEVVSLEKSL